MIFHNYVISSQQIKWNFTSYLNAVIWMIIYDIKIKIINYRYHGKAGLDWGVILAILRHFVSIGRISKIRLIRCNRFTGTIPLGYNSLVTHAVFSTNLHYSQEKKLHHNNTSFFVHKKSINKKPILYMFSHFIIFTHLCVHI